MAIQPSTSPDTYTAPGKPINNQPDISDAPADMAVTKLPSLRPPKI